MGIIGKPATTPAFTYEGEVHDLSSAPQYLVYPLNWGGVALSEAGTSLITHKFCVTDFGESYDVSSPPSNLGIPLAYSSPEYDLEKKIGFPNDVWALGCTLFEICAKRKLFSTWEDEVDEHLFMVAVILGKFP